MSDFVSAPEVAVARETLDRLRTNMRQAIKGKDDVIEQLLICLLSRRPPADRGPARGRQDHAGLFAGALDGLRVFEDPVHQRPAAERCHGRRHLRRDDPEFVFKPGPVFANIVLADEINRATPKTQSALLEVMDRAR
jgi:MoxR-like ATPase